MPIPALNADGLLPIGVFDCTLVEVRTQFGSFQGSDTRQRLFGGLEDLVVAMQRSGLFEALLLDGSLSRVSRCRTILMSWRRYAPDTTSSATCPCRNMRSFPALCSDGVSRFDIIVAERESKLYMTYVEFFSRVRENPEARKGLLRLTL